MFRLQHNGMLPGACPLVASGGPAGLDDGTFWAQMTQYSDLSGHTSPTKTERYCYGPYMQSENAMNGNRRIASAPGRGVGYVYDFAGGAGTGKVWGVDESGAVFAQ